MKICLAIAFCLLSLAVLTPAQDTSWKSCVLVLPCIMPGPEAPRKLVRYEVPDYPQIAIAANADGEVKLQVKINAEGRVTMAVPTGGHPLLMRAAAESARKWQFAKGEPADLEVAIVFNVGKKTRAKMRKPYRLEFTIRPPKVVHTVNYDTTWLSASSNRLDSASSVV